MSDTIELAKDLISRRSLTPEDDGCQNMLADRLGTIGFKATHLRFEDVDNLWITHGQGDPVFTFVGHTDVVPTGPLEKWDSDPFTPEIRDGMLYGRGAADMKSGIAAFITAVERFISQNPEHIGTIALLITSDEEGPSINGTRKVVDYLQENNIKIKWCLVGEPSSVKKIGDVVKNGRRGSLGATLIVRGVQGHVAYPHLADNPVHKLVPALDELCAKVWDEGNEFYPPTSFQISNIHAGTGADNVIPGQTEVLFNYRFCTEITEQELRTQTEAIFDKYDLNYEIIWRLSGHPFLTPEGSLINAVKSAVKDVAGYDTELSTAGGTSDGRFIAPTGAEVVELGPLNETIHKLNECVSVEDLDLLSEMYENILNTLLRQ
ncbi:MAG: succinyl-diaminopimelate desuccinylase [Gammaproteobacteria bacterium]|jgi:succinyl-diaminopimelate desuccinylase